MQFWKFSRIRLIGLMSILFSISPVTASALVLSEIYYDAPGSDDGLEWVELYNPSVSAIDLTGYSSR